MTLAPWAASAVPPPTTNLAFDVLAQRVAYSNQTLLDYFFPQAPRAADVQHSWWPHTRHCGQAQCYCVHVTGPSDPRINPSPAKPCLSSYQHPNTVAATIALARAAGIDHIVEEGREGGLTAFMYSLHGFKVTSVEYGPIDEVSLALARMAPAPRVTMRDGDGRVLVPEVVASLSDAEAARTLIFFDGEKRVFAHRTWEKVKGRVGMAAFDDSIPEFESYLAGKHEVAWSTSKFSNTHIRGLRMRVKNATGAHLAIGREGKQTRKVIGSVHRLEDPCTVFVTGGGWGKGAAPTQHP